MPKINLNDRYIQVPLGFTVHALPEYIYNQLTPDSKLILFSVEEVGSFIQSSNSQKNSLVFLKNVMVALAYFKKNLRFKEARIEKAIQFLEDLNLFKKNKAQCFVLQSIGEGNVNHV